MFAEELLFSSFLFRSVRERRSLLFTAAAFRSKHTYRSARSCGKFDSVAEIICAAQKHRVPRRIAAGTRFPGRKWQLSNQGNASLCLFIACGWKWILSTQCSSLRAIKSPNPIVSIKIVNIILRYSSQIMEKSQDEVHDYILVPHI